MSGNMSRKDFIAACISALEDRGTTHVQVGQKASDKITPPKTKTESQSPRSPSQTAMRLADQNNDSLKLPQPTNNTSCIASSTTNTTTENMDERVDLPLLSVLSRIRSGDVSTVSSQELQSLTDDVVQWIDDFENNHKSIRTFISHFQDAALLSESFLTQFHSFCGKGSFTPSLKIQHDGIEGNERKKSLKTKANIAPRAHLASLIYLTFPYTLLRFEKFLLRTKSVTAVFGETFAQNLKNKSSSIAALRLREALLRAASSIPLHVIGHARPEFWSKHGLTNIVLKLEMIHLQFCKDMANTNFNTKSSHQNNTESSKVHTFWTPEFNFLNIIREYSLCNPLLLGATMKAVVEWTIKTVKSSQQLHKDAGFDTKKSADPIAVACIHASSHFIADVLRPSIDAGASTSRHVLQLVGGQRLLELYLRCTDITCETLDAVIWVRLNEALLYVASQSPVLANACLKSGVVFRNLATAFTLRHEQDDKVKESAAQADSANSIHGINDASTHAVGRDEESIVHILCNFAATSSTCRQWMAQVPSLKPLECNAQYGLAWSLLMTTVPKRACSISPQEVLHRYQILLKPLLINASGHGSLDQSKLIDIRIDGQRKTPLKAPTSVIPTSVSSSQTRRRQLKNLEKVIRQLGMCRGCLKKFKPWEKLRECVSNVGVNIDQLLPLLEKHLQNCQKGPKPNSNFDPSPNSMEEPSSCGDSKPNIVTAVTMKELDALHNEIIALRNIRSRIKVLTVGSKSD